MPTPAQRLTRQTIALLEAHYPTWLVKPNPDALTRRGVPDLIGVVAGVPVALEIKAPGDSLSPLQTYELGQAARAGATAIVVQSPEDALEAVRRALIRARGTQATSKTKKPSGRT